MMGLNVEDVIAGLDPAERRKVENLAAEFIAEEMTLRELRKARKLTQVSVARELGVSQDAISRLEQRSDLLLSTLRRAVEAMGGSLSLIARFPDRPRSSSPASPGARPATDSGPAGPRSQDARSAASIVGGLAAGQGPVLVTDHGLLKGWIGKSGLRRRVSSRTM